MKSAFPRLTVLVSVAALAVFASGDFATLLQYDRGAIVSGEVWRLFAGHLVHYSLMHLVFDLVTFAVAGWAIERRGYPGFGMLLFFSALCISLFMMLWLPQMRFYGGLSGLVFATLFYLALWEIATGSVWRSTAGFVVVVLVMKVGFELYSRDSLLVHMTGGDFVPVPMSHAVGLITAIVLFARIWAGKRRQERSIPAE